MKKKLGANECRFCDRVATDMTAEHTRSKTAYHLMFRDLNNRYSLIQICSNCQNRVGVFQESIKEAEGKKVQKTI